MLTPRYKLAYLTPKRFFFCIFILRVTRVCILHATRCAIINIKTHKFLIFGVLEELLEFLGVLARGVARIGIIATDVLVNY